MAGGVITAAWIQAAPVWVGGAVAVYGLSTWRRQLRGQRQLEHAEKALAIGAETFAAVRAVRSRYQKLPSSTPNDAFARREATLTLINRRFEQAWDVFHRFQGHYALAWHYTLSNESELYVSKEVAYCLFTLQNLAEEIFTDWGDSNDPVYASALVAARLSFYGHPVQGHVDEIEGRLTTAEGALALQLNIVLKPASSSKRVKRAFREVARGVFPLFKRIDWRLWRRLKVNRSEAPS